MKMLYLLVVLTQNGAGDINAAFVNTDSFEQCEQKTRLLENMFIASNIPVLKKYCQPSNLRFSEFEHAASSAMIRYFYLVEFDQNKLTIDAMKNWQSCMRQVKDNTSESRYCVSSVQVQVL